MISSCLLGSTTTNYTTGRVREPKSFFRDEVSYTKSILEYAKPFLRDFKKTISFFTTASLQDVLVRAKKSLADWKTLSDSKEKVPQSKFSKGGILFSDIKPEDRSLLGVQHTTDWLDTFNIDCVMQMDPLKHKEYAQTRDIANDLSREALQEKVLSLYESHINFWKAVYQSVIFFITATEVQFIDSTKPSSNNSSDKKSSKTTFSYKPPMELPNA